MSQRCLVTPGARRRRRGSLGSVGVFGGQRFHQIDDPAAHLHIGDPDEGAVELQPLGAGAEFDGESRRRRPRQIRGSRTISWPGASSKKNATGTLRIEAIACRRLAPTRLVPFSYFWICWNVMPRFSPSFSWLMPSMLRRSRMRLPTWMSVGFGFFLFSCDHFFLADFAGFSILFLPNRPIALPHAPANRLQNRRRCTV